MKPHKTTQSFKYRLLMFVSFIMSFVGFLGLKLTAVIVATGIALLTEKYFGNFSVAIGYIVGLLTASILLIGLQRLYPYLEKLDDYTKTLKSYPYTEKYGKDYPHPTPEDFGITQAEFKDYNSRFQFEFIKLIFTYGLWVAVLIYVIRKETKVDTVILLMGCTGLIAILLSYVFDYSNKMISQKHRYYDKVHKFQQALNIYFRIRDENSNL